MAHAADGKVRNAMANDTLKKIRAAYDTVTECPKWDDRTPALRVTFIHV